MNAEFLIKFKININYLL